VKNTSLQGVFSIEPNNRICSALFSLALTIFFTESQYWLLNIKKQPLFNLFVSAASPQFVYVPAKSLKKSKIVASV